MICKNCGRNNCGMTKIKLPTACYHRSTALGPCASCVDRHVREVADASRDCVAHIARHCGVSRQAAHHRLIDGIPPACEVCGSRTVPHYAWSLACLRAAVAVLRAERDQARADVRMLREAAGLSVTVYGGER